MMKFSRTFAVSTRVPIELISGTDEGYIFLGCLIENQSFYFFNFISLVDKKLTEEKI